MESIFIVLGMTFAVVFLAKFIWSFIILVGGFFWKISSILIVYAFLAVGIIFYVNVVNVQ